MLSLWEVLKASKGLPAPDGFTALFAHSLSDTYTLAEISGIPPLNLGEIVEIVDYAIYGNTYQSDGVSPDTPQEVKGCGERTGNLFYFPETKEDGSSVLIKRNEGESNFYITKNNDNNVKRELPINTVLKAGIYTLSVKGFLNNNDFIYFTNSDGSNVGYYATLSSPKTFTLTEETAISNICCYTLSGSKYDNTEICVMLNEGSTPLPYEPYGYKADAVSRGKNLWNLQSSYSFTTYYDINVNINAGHYLSYIIETNGTTDVYDGTGCQLTFSDNTTQYVLFNATYRKSILLSKDVKIVRVYAGKDYNTSVGFTATVSEIMVSANADDSYEPYTPPLTTPIYLDSPLYKIGDYSDSRGMTEEVRVIKELVLTGEENIYIYTGTGSNGIAIPIADMQRGFYQDGFCSHAIVAKNHADGTIGLGVENNNLYWFGILDILGIATVADFKSYLAAQYANGTPVTVYYVLSTPKTKTVEPVEIPTIQGTNIIDINTEVKPSNLKITYKSKM